MEIEFTVSPKGMLAGLFWSTIRQAIGDSLPAQAADFAGRIAGAAEGSGR
jgi:hypothetical protein